MPEPKRRRVVLSSESKQREGGWRLVEHLARDGDVNESYARENARAAREGDTDAARTILEDFVGAIDARSERVWPSIGPPIHWAYARYLADAFKRILDGEEDAALALRIKSNKAGRRRGSVTHNTEALAAAYWYLVRAGYKPERANELLGAQTGASRRTIQIASTANGNESYKYSQLQEDEILKLVFKPYATKVAAILREHPPQGVQRRPRTGQASHNKLRK